MLKNSFTEEGLRDLCFELGIDYESLPGANKRAKARELLGHLDRRGRLDKLLAICKEKRDNLNWDIIKVEDNENLAAETFSSVKPPRSDGHLDGHGLIHAFKIPVDDPYRQLRVYDLIDQEAKGDKHLRLTASSGYSYLNPNGMVWKVKLGRLITGNLLKMTVVLESPFSNFAITRALANNVTFHQWQEKQRPEHFIRLLLYPNVTIRVTDKSVNCSLFFAGGSVYYDPYLWGQVEPFGITENNFWVFEFKEIEQENISSYTLLERHFDFLLRHSIPLEELLHAPEDDSAEIPRGPDFYELFQTAPDVALNRYNNLTQQFGQKVRSLVKRG